MGLKFRIFTKAEHYTMSSPAAMLRKAAASAKAAPKTVTKATSSATSSAATKATSSAAPKAAPVAVPKECDEYNAGKPCHRGQSCRDKRCRKASMAAAASLPKSSGKGGDGAVTAQLAAIEKRLIGIESKIDSGFDGQRNLSLELQEQASLLYFKTMNMFNMFGQKMFNDSRPELSAPHAHRAICASPMLSAKSSVTEVCGESSSSFARGGGPSSSFARHAESSSSSARGGGPSEMTGTHIDGIMMLCVDKGILPDGHTSFVLRQFFGKKTVSDHHKSLLSQIVRHTTDDEQVALLFLLLTGSKQFTASSSMLDEFRKSCTHMLHPTNINDNRKIFVKVCKAMIWKNPKWEIKKNEEVIVSNADLSNDANHGRIFDYLTKNFDNFE